jgi:threonyl-tRNA synthetase
VHFDDRDDKIGAKIREAHQHKPVWQVVVGERDAENQTVSVKSRDGDLGALPLAEFVAIAVAASQPPFGG